MSDFVTQPVRTRDRGITQAPNRQQASSANSNRWMQKGLVLVALIALVGMVIGFVKPILLAGLFAATLYPFHLKLQSKIKSNNVRAGLLTTGFAFLFLLPVGAVVFLAASAGLKKAKDLPEDWATKIDIEPLLHSLEGVIPMERAELMKHVQTAATGLGRGALNLLQNLVADLPKLAIVNVVILFGMFVLLSQAKPVLNWLRKLSPFSESQTDRFFNRVGGLSSSSVLATIASGFVQALLIGLLLLIMQYPGAWLITMTAFVFSFLPIIGTAPVAIFLIGSAAIEGNWTHVIIFVIASGIVAVSDNVVRPFVLSDAGKLNAFIAFIAAVGALETMGFYGLFLGPVVAGAVLTLVELVHEDRTA